MWLSKRDVWRQIDSWLPIETESIGNKSLFENGHVSHVVILVSDLITERFSLKVGYLMTF